MPDTHTIATTPNAILLFEDGTEFQGYGVGAEGMVCGELCFNTSMTGYQEVLTDPSYHRQIVTFTAPHIGNVGCNAQDVESDERYAAGLVLREAVTQPSNWRAQSHLHDWLDARDITGITGVDTRALTVHMRLNGAPKVAIAYAKDGLDAIDRGALMSALHDTPSMKGAELAGEVMRRSQEAWTQGGWDIRNGYATSGDGALHVVALDFGAKHNILRLLVEKGCRVTVVPGDSAAQDVLDLQPDGVFLSNGPGDPAATASYALPTIRTLLDAGTPLFGICLGHQLLASALGAKTEKMYQGHRGANHPVKNMATQRVEITSQNHGFVVRSDGLPRDVEITHVSLFDGTIEGIRHKTKPAFSVQHHPEASPGPRDSAYLFDQFVAMIRDTKAA